MGITDKVVDPDLSVSDLLVEEPWLRLISPRAPDRLFHGLCAPGEGDVAGWLVFVEADNVTLRARLRDLEGACGVVWRRLTGPTAEDRPSGGSAAALDQHDHDLIRQAQARGILLIQCDPRLTRNDIQMAVSRLQRRNPNIRSWRRLTVTEKLSPALLAPRPEEGLLERFSRLSGEAVLYLAREGEVLASAGELPARSIARQLRGVRDNQVTFRLGRWSVYARSVAVSDTQRVVGESTWLVRGLRSGNAPDPGDPSAAALTDLLLVVKEQRNNISKAQLINASELLEGFRSDEADKEKIIQGLLSRGFSHQAQIRLLVAGQPGDGFRTELHPAPTAVAGEIGAPLVIGNLQGRLGVLTTDSDQIRRLAATLPPPVGVSAGARGVQVAANSGLVVWRQALVAALNADGRHAEEVEHDGVALFDDCGPVERAAATLRQTDLRACVEGLDAELNGLKGGIDIALALVRHDLSSGRAAKDVGVHPNTVRNRLQALAEAHRFRPFDLGLWAVWRGLDAYGAA